MTTRKTPHLPLGKPDTAAYADLAVLVLEDSPHLVGVVCGILKSFGVGRIHAARDSEDALFILANQRVNVAVIDELKPPRDGLSLVRTIRTAAAQLPNELPIIYLTEVPHQGAIIAARDAGVTEVLSKPFSASQLMTRISSAIRNPRPLVRSEDFVGPDRRRRTKEPTQRKRQADIAPAGGS
ncbi:response regulator [Parvibaculum sedimenti]|uniref:Response regulator n=1 Tax=Parvibaculum sedimenti TaxID=2608632 RepID=A0A6N6VND7_9HYPH|nr:response regulator [Parvibaculum sedimenti]KAB7741268.1 response regulator [Parvibaculum sedimenti]